MARSLLDKKRFSALEAQKEAWLKNLSFKEAIRIQEGLLSSEIIWQLRKNFFKDTPVDLKRLLRKKHAKTAR